MTATETRNLLSRAQDSIARVCPNASEAGQLKLAAMVGRFVTGTPLGQLTEDRRIAQVIVLVVADMDNNEEEENEGQ